MLANKNNLVSLIVPVYNAEKHIVKCLQSIQEQSYTNFEVILVDDCSTDNSYSICQKFETNDKRFRTIRMPQNSGAGDARRKGIQMAQGYFIGFVDSDDWLGRNFLYCLLQLQEETNADIVSCQALHCKQDGDVFVNFPINLKRSYSPKEALILLEQENILYPVLWDKLYKRDIVLSCDIQSRSCEDGYALVDYIKMANKVAFTGLPLYHYNKADNNLSGSVSRVEHFKFYCHLASVLKKEFRYKSSHIIPTGLNHLQVASCFRYNKKARAYIIQQFVELVKSMEGMNISCSEKLQRYLAIHYTSLYTGYYKIYMRIFHKRKNKEYSMVGVNEYKILLKEIVHKINLNNVSSDETFDYHNLFE